MFYIFLRNSTEFQKYSLWEWMFFLVCFDFLRRFRLNACIASFFKISPILDDNFFCDRVNLQVINLDQQMFCVFLSSMKASCHDSAFLSLRRFFVGVYVFMVCYEL